MGKIFAHPVPGTRTFARGLPRFLVLAGLALCAHPTGRALEIGAGYNEQISDINNVLLARSGVRWVRAYVNIPRNYLLFSATANPHPNPPPNPVIYPMAGVNVDNMAQDADHVSTDADTLAVAAIDKLIYAKTVRAGGEPLKVILSLKQDFTYPYPATGAPDQIGRVPDPNTPEGAAELEHLITAIENLLTVSNRGAYIDILVLGNEPMFEVQPNNDPVTAANYAAYLELLLARLHTLRSQNAANGWDFRLFIGALNHPSDPSPADNAVLPAVLNVLQTNPLVDGLDLHEHVSDPNDVATDLATIKPYLQPGQSVIATEFSLIELWSTWQNEPIGAWGPLNGYGPGSASQSMVWWLNTVINDAAAGKPISRAKFLSFFESRSWYPQGWFTRMIAHFENAGVEVVTYGLEEPPRYPWSLNQLDDTSTPWVLNGVYNASLLGTNSGGLPETNPIVWPGFDRAVQKFNRRGP